METLKYTVNFPLEEKEQIAFERWAFGSPGQWYEITTMEAWNALHSDLLKLEGTDGIKESVDKMYTLYKEYGVILAQWVSVEERLPKYPDWQLVTDGKIVTQGCYEVNSWVGTDPHIEPTHWMPLPTPPES